MLPALFNILIWYVGLSIGQLQGGYQHDGRTVYCWQVNKNSSAIIQEATGNDCPLSMSLQLSKSVVRPGESVYAKWTIRMQQTVVKPLFDLSDRIYAKVEKSNGIAEIVHSNLHSCLKTRNCDPFTSEEHIVVQTENQFGNFTPKNQLTFESSELFLLQPTQYLVMAHIYLVSNTMRYEFATYQMLDIQDNLVTAPTTPHGFVFDGETTYCWQSAQPSTKKMPQYSLVTKQAQGSSCPLRLSLSSPSKVRANEKFDITWTIQRLPKEAFSQLTFTVVSSAIESCFEDLNCSPFYVSQKRDTLDYEPELNLSASSTQTFTSPKLQLQLEGLYSIFAHIIVPQVDNTTANSRLDITAFAKLQVRSNVTTGRIVGFALGTLGGVVILLGMIFVYRVRRQQISSTEAELTSASTSDIATHRGLFYPFSSVKSSPPRQRLATQRETIKRVQFGDNESVDIDSPSSEEELSEAESDSVMSSYDLHFLRKPPYAFEM